MLLLCSVGFAVVIAVAAVVAFDVAVVAVVVERVEWRWQR